MGAIRLHARLSLGPPGAAVPRFSIRSCRLVEAVSDRRHATLEIASEEPIALEPLLEAEAELVFSGTTERTFPLVLGAGDYLGHERNNHHYRLQLFDPLWLLGLTRTTRKFRNASAEAIVARVLDEFAIKHRFQLAQATPIRKYCAQYRESNLDFIHRLLEFEGIHYFHDDDGALVLADTSASAPRVADAPFELIEAEDALTHGAIGISELRRVARVETGRITASDYNWKKPRLELRESASAAEDTQLARYELFAGFRLPDQGARIARLRLEAHRAMTRSIEGNVGASAFAPGHAFAVGSTAGDAFAGDYFLCRVEHALEPSPDRDAAAEASLTYHARFTAIPLATPFRPMPRAPRPSVGGVHTAMVRGPAGEEIHTDRHGRFRAQFHWDQDGTGSDQDSRWLRMMQETSTSMTLARTGWEVSVGYIDGDPDRPIGLNRMINGVMAPTFGLPENQNMMAVRTPSSPASGGYSEITMDDSGSAQAIRLRAEKDLDIAVRNEKTERVGQDEAHFVGTDLTRRVLGDQSITIGRHSTTTVDNSAQIRVQGRRSVEVGGSEQASVGASQSAAVGGRDSEKVGALRLTVAGAIKPPDFKAMARSAATAFAGTLSPALAQAAAAASSGAGLTGLMPSVTSLLTSSRPSLGGQGLAAAGRSALAQATGGLTDGVTIDKLIALVATGGIERAAGGSMTRMVGGAYITVAVLGIDTKVAHAHLEAVGAVKLTAAARNIVEGVSGDLKILVGGSVTRMSGEKMSILSGTTSAVSVGGAARYAAGQKLTITADVVRIESEASFLLKGGGAEVRLTPDKVSLEGELHLHADGVIKITGGSRLDLT